MSRTARPSHALVVALILVGSSSSAVFARPQGDAPPPFLLTLRGGSVVVNYTPGGLDRAYHVKARFELLASDFSKWVRNPIRLRVFVLTRDEWSQFGFGVPYGLPGRIRGETLAVPWAGDDGTVRLWTEIRGEPPPPLPGIPLRGTAEEAATLAMADLLTEVEAVRILLTAGGLRGEQPWVHQLLAHLVARAAFARYEGPRLPEIDAFFAGLGTGERSIALDRYTEGLDLATLLWFESRFQEGARLVLENGKRNEVAEIIKRTRKAGGLLTEAELLERHPQLRGWLDESFSE